MKSQKQALLFIFATVLIDVIGIGIIIPVIPSLIQNLSEYTFDDVAWIGSLLLVAYAGMQFLFAPLVGELSDRFGRRPVLLVALLGLGVDYIFHAFAPTLTLLFVGRFLAGILGSSFTVANSYIADISTKENKAKNFGVIGAAFGIGFIVGPVIGGVSAEFWGYRAPFFAAAGLTLLNFFYGLFFIPESLPIEKRRPIELLKALPIASLMDLGKYKAFGGLLLAFFLANIAGQALPTSWTYFTIEKFKWTELDIGLSLAFIGFMVAIVQAVLLGKIVKKFGEKKTIMFGFILWSIGMILFSIAGSTLALYAFMIPYILGGVASPTIQGYMSNHVADNKQGNLQGSLTSMISITAIIGPLIYGGLFDWFVGEGAPWYYPGAPYAMGAIFLSLGCVVAIISLRKLGSSMDKAPVT